MRREKYEIKDEKRLSEILKKCQVMRLAVNDENGYPYIVPVNYGFEFAEGVWNIYIHGADAGTKKELIMKDTKVGFEMDINENVVINDEISCDSYMCYESVCGTGNAVFLENDEKVKALTAIMNHYTGAPVHFDKKTIDKTMVIKIQVSKITGKFLQK